MHLIFPLIASVLLIVGLILIKRAGAAGAGPMTTLFITNECTAIAFSALWLFDETGQPWQFGWQPAVIALLFMLGLMFTFLAIERGDVSVATPVLGVKVIFVALLLTVIGKQSLPIAIWLAAVLASAGIALIQWTGRGHRKRVVFTILFALSAATTFATFDVLVQSWSPTWGATRFLPIVFAMVGFLSLGMVPWVDWSALRKRETRRLVIFGAIMIALQSIAIVLTIAVFGDAARVNIVYALRGMWGVGLAWWAARIWGGPEANLGRSAMLIRTAGAVLLCAAVVMAIATDV